MGSKKQKLKKKLPINLLRKAQREKRNRIGNVKKTKKSRRKTRRARKPNFERLEHEALIQKTEEELRRILESSELLSDIPYDCTPDELLGEIAIAKGHATTVYVQRDGLSTLTIVLPQQNPTIANLKRAIESTARVQLKRELRERHEERLKRRQRRNQRENTTTIDMEEEIGLRKNSSKSKSNNSKGGNANMMMMISSDNITSDEQQQVASAVVSTTISTTSTIGSSTAAFMESTKIKSTGEFIQSISRCGGHQHRSNVSWRFLWRAYALFNVDMNQPLDDRCDGSKLLSECGIENTTTLKFCKREHYFGRKRQ